jgi:CRP-like cAMP-binding protein
LKPKYYEKGDVLMKPDDVSDSIFFIEEGVVEVYTLFEGNIFVLDRLYRGSVMNYRTFFIDDLNYIYA